MRKVHIAFHPTSQRSKPMRRQMNKSLLLRLPLLAACAGVLALAGPAAPAGAATEIGQVSAADPGGGCTNCASVQIATDSSANYVMPADGVVTSWRFRANGNPGTAHLRIYRPAAVPGDFELVAKTADRSFALNEEATVPARVAVKAGDHIGIGVTGPAPVFDTGDPDDRYGGVDFFLPIGSVATPNSFGGRRVNMAATLEADADRDGFGDETQDGCPGDPASQATCTPGSSGGSGGSLVPPSSLAVPARDSSAPRVTLAAPRRESVKRGTLHVFATSNEAATGAATGKVTLGRTAKAYRLRQTTTPLAPGVRRKIVLRIPKRALLAIRAALADGRSPTARLTLLVRDPTGNATKALRTISLAR
jgi:hypothetical protein